MLGKALSLAAAGNAGEETDENFNQTVLLLHGDGNQGATNFSNTGPTKYLAFSDNSDNNFPITVNGDAYGDNTSPFQVEEGQWSNYFAGTGTGGYLTFPSSSEFTFGTGDFTVECFAFITGTGTGIFQQGTSNFPTTDVNSVGLATTGGPSNPRFYIYAKNTTTYSTFNWAYNTWYHLALVRLSGTTTLYANGTAVITVSSDTTNYTGTYLGIGSLYGTGTSERFTGNISNFRVIKGTALYTGSFTPPTAFLTAVSGTSLLTCQSNRYKDNSANAFAVTITGNTKVTFLNPFTTEYNTVDGSGYFDGNGDRLTVPNGSDFTFSGAFSVEGWIYPTNLATGCTFLETRTGFTTTNYAFYCNTTTSQPRVITSGGVILSSSVNPIANQWNHIAWSSDGSTLRVYVNGVSGGTVAQGSLTTGAATTVGFGGTPLSATNYALTGFMSNLRVVNGTDTYPSAFTPPTAPLTAVTNTKLLTCQYAGSVRNVGFIDSGPYDFPITRNGNTTQGTFSPFSAPDGRWSNYFGGGSDYLSLDGSSDFAFGTGDFTIELFIYFDSLPASGQFATLYDSRPAGTNGNYPTIYIDGSTKYLYYLAASANLITGPAITAHVWNHIVVSRVSGNTRMFLNGTQAGSTYSDSINYLNGATDRPFIGAASLNTPASFGFVNGYISSVRVIKGSGVTSVTVPTSPLSTSTANQKLLTCYSNRFVDFNTATTAKTITLNGSPKVTPFSPFAPTAAYSPSVNGGSGYFDGSGDYLSVANNAELNFGNGDFMLEAWVYPTAYKTFAGIATKGPSSSTTGFTFQIANGTLRIVMGTTSFSSGTAIPLNAWTHVAVSREGTTLRQFVNGTEVSSATSSYNVDTTSAYLVGSARNNTDTSNHFIGYISNQRAVKGSAVHTASFTPPASPLTAISGTSLLCNFTNAGIFDSTGKNVLETVDNAQVDTTVKKYGTGSMKFDGTGDGLFRPFTQDLNFGTGDFTIEWWMYFNSKSGYQTIISFGYSPQASTGWLIQTGNGDGKIIFYTQSAGTIIASDTGSTVNTGEWYHMAVVRSSGTTTIYRNGVSVGSGADTTNYTATTANFYVGGGSNTAFNNYYFNGFIDDLRITKGVARYTTTFTPPDKAFPDQ